MVKRATAVALYLPVTSGLAVAMLACARIGAVPLRWSFLCGFSLESLRDRVNDSLRKVPVTADGGYRRGQIVPLEAR